MQMERVVEALDKDQSIDWGDRSIVTGEDWPKDKTWTWHLNSQNIIAESSFMSFHTQSGRIWGIPPIAQGLEEWNSRAQSWRIRRFWKRFWGFAAPKAKGCGGPSHLFSHLRCISHGQHKIRIGNSCQKPNFLSFQAVVCASTRTILYTLLKCHSFILYHHGETESHRWPKSGRINSRAEEQQTENYWNYL